MTQLKQNANHWWTMAVAVLLLIAAATCNAQTFRGGIGGTLTDAAGVRIAGAVSLSHWQNCCSSPKQNSFGRGGRIGFAASIEEHRTLA